LAACSSSSTSSTTTSVKSSANTSSSATTSSSSAPATGFQALDGEYLPGTSSSSWSALSAPGALLSGVTGEDLAGSNDSTYAVAIFNFATPAQAMAFYSNPPGAITGFVGGALGYTPLGSSSVINGVTSQGLDLRSCTGEGSGPSYTASGQCSNGTPSFSVGVGKIFTASTLVLMVAWLSGNTNATGSPSDLSKVDPYVTGAQTLLTRAGI
jgi:hypothetical protein